MGGFRSAAGGRDRALLVVAGLTLAALALRVLVARQTVTNDELLLYEVVHGRGLRGMISAVHDTESTPPLHFILAWLAGRIGGHGLFWIRIPSLVLGTATVPLIYILGRRTVGRTAALIGTALFAIAPFDIYFGTEGRAYATVAFLSVASTLALLELLRARERRWAVAYVLLTAALLYTHYTAVFVVAAQLGWALWTHRSQARRLLFLSCAVGLIYLPWIPSLVFQTHDSAANRIAFLYPLTAGSYLSGVGRAWFGYPAVGLREVPGSLGEAMFAAGIVVASLVAGFHALRSRSRIRPAAGLVVVLALATPLGALLYSLVGTSIFLPRNMSASVPAALLATGMLLAALRHPAVVAGAVALVMGGVGIGTVHSLQRDLQRPDYRDAAHYVDRVAGPEIPVVELSLGGPVLGRQLRYWFGKPHRYFALGTPFDAAYRLGRRRGRLYIVAAGRLVPLLALLRLPQQGFRLVARRSYPGLPAIEVLTYRPLPRRGPG